MTRDERIAKVAQRLYEERATKDSWATEWAEAWAAIAVDALGNELAALCEFCRSAYYSAQDELVTLTERLKLAEAVVEAARACTHPSHINTIGDRFALVEALDALDAAKEGA